MCVQCYIPTSVYAISIPIYHIIHNYLQHNKPFPIMTIVLGKFLSQFNRMAVLNFIFYFMLYRRLCHLTAYLSSFEARDSGSRLCPVKRKANSKLIYFDTECHGEGNRGKWTILRGPSLDTRSTLPPKSPPRTHQKDICFLRKHFKTQSTESLR